jgi:VanZ family protein
MQLAYVLIVLGTAIISIGCLSPKHWLPPLPNDKYLHFIAFGGLALLAGQVSSSRYELVIWLFALLLAGCLIEAVQHWIPGRSFCWRDIAANAAGIFTAGLINAILI